MEESTRVTRNCKKCVVCNKRQIPGANVFLTKIPLEPNRCRMWIKAIGQEDLVYIPIEKLHQLKYVCNLHFRTQDFNEAKTRLLKTAVPCLNMPLKPLDDECLHNFPLHIGQYPQQGFASRTETAAKPGPSYITDEQNFNISHGSTAIPESSQENITVRSYSRKAKGSSLTPLSSREEKLLKKLKTQKMTIKKLAKVCLDLEKLDDNILKDLVKDIAKNMKKKPTGKRWSVKTKLWALAVFKRSPKAYRHLETEIKAPSIKTLQRLLRKIPLKPGINKNIISKCKDILKNSSNSSVSSSDQNRLCALLFDEMALKKRLIYDEVTDKIEGFEDYGDERTSKIADHALVFIVQGIRQKFKVPIAFYFVQWTISSEKLSVILKNVIIAVEDAEFTVVTTVCDQGPTNLGALNLLKKFSHQPPESNYFVLNNNKKIYIMFDIPHLFKSVRNNFLNAGEILWADKTGQWRFLIQAEEENRGFLNFPKITKNVVQPTYKLKMRVKYAVQALSNTMQAILRMLAWKYPEAANEINETADIIQELDQLFDVCNGPSSPKDVKKGKRENVSANTNHIERWRYYREKINKMKFLKSDSHLQLNNVRCIKGFQISLKSLEDIWDFVKKEGFQYLNLRQLNQDSLENLFGLIRQHSATNKNTTCTHFIADLKTSIITGCKGKNIRGSNCEADDNQFFFQIDKNEEAIENKPTAAGQSFSDAADINVPELYLPEDVEDLQSNDLSTFENQPVVYVSGYLASKLLRNNDCSQCKISLTNENPVEHIYDYISLREWWEEKKSLTYPSISLCHMVDKAKTIFENLQNLHEANVILNCILQFTVQCDLSWFNCTEHSYLKQELLKLLSSIFIRKYCKSKNESFSNSENTTNDQYKLAQTQSKA